MEEREEKKKYLDLFSTRVSYNCRRWMCPSFDSFAHEKNNNNDRKSFEIFQSVRSRMKIVVACND